MRIICLESFLNHLGSTFSKAPFVGLFLVVFLLMGAASSHAAADSDFTTFGPGGAGGTYVPSFSPYTKGLVFIATDMGAAFRSTTGGQSWELIHWSNGLRFVQFAPTAAFLPDGIFWSSSFRILKESRDGGVTWKPSGERPWKKEKIKQLVALEGSPDVLLVGSEKAVWRSEDRGASFKKVLPVGGSEFVELGNTIYMMAFSNTLMVSRDRGKTWTPKSVAVKGLKNDRNILSMVGGISPSGDVLFASIKGLGIIRTRNGGDTWDLVKSPYKGEKHLVMDKSQGQVVYAAQTGGARNNQLLKSSDGGESWEEAFRLNVKWSKKLFSNANVTPSWTQTELSWGYFITNKGVAIDPFDPDHLILTTQGDIYETRNGAKTWTPIINKVLPPVEGDKADRYESIGLEVTSCWNYYIDSFEPNRHYAAYTDIGFVRSIDGGNSWSWSAQGSPWRNTFYQLALDPDVPGRIFAATSRRHDIPHDMSLSPTKSTKTRNLGGVVVSNNFGKSWKVPYDKSAPDGLPKLICTTIALDPKSPVEKRTLYAGLFGEDELAGVYRSDDGGKTWAQKSIGLGVAPNKHVYRIVIHPKSGNLYCLITGLRKRGMVYTIPGGVWKSTDKGENWTHISAGSDLNWHSTSLTINPEDEQEMFVTATSPPGHWLTGGVYRTRNGGKSWDHILTDKQIAKAAGGKSWDHTMSFAIHPKDPNVFYAGTTLHGLLYSENKGRSWKGYDAFPFGAIQSINFDPKNADTIIVTTFGGGMWRGPALPR